MTVTLDRAVAAPPADAGSSLKLSLIGLVATAAGMGVIGLPIGVALLIGTLEFVGPNERNGWPLAGTIVPIAYIAWSLWLIALGVWLLL